MNYINKNVDKINKSIYNVNNPYGYKININHPRINQLYRRYLQWKGYSACYPLSREQRLEFEEYILKALKKNEKEFEV